MKIKKAKEKDLERINEFFIQGDRDFFPRLSERLGGVKRYTNDSEIYYLEKEGEVTGAICYKKDGEGVDIGLARISPQHRNSSTFKQLISAPLKRTYENLPIKTETWSTNKRMRNLLVHLGFEKTGEIESDMHPDRTTIKYAGNTDQIKELLKIPKPGFIFGNTPIPAWLVRGIAASYVLATSSLFTYSLITGNKLPNIANFFG